MRKMLLILFLLLAFVTPLRDVSAPRELAIVTIEGDVITGNTLPRYGELCEAATVHGSPAEDSAILYILPVGKVVRLREQSHGGNRSWVMIAPANWLKISALCKR